MSVVTAHSSDAASDAAGAVPGWLTVAQHDIKELWLGGRGPILMLVLSLLLSVLTYLTATNKELNFLDQKNTVNLIAQVAVGIAVALSMMLSADTLSGERERGTLESLLLTPLRRREIAFGKLLAALTIWPAVVLLTLPYLWALRVGSSIFFDAFTTGLVVGTLLVVAFGCLGIVVSTYATSNRISLALTFFVFIALMVPTQLPGGALKGWLGTLIYRVNPVSAGARFMDRVIVSGHTWNDEAAWLVAPIIAAAAGIVAAVVVTGRLRLQGGVQR